MNCCTYHTEPYVLMEACTRYAVHTINIIVKTQPKALTYNSVHSDRSFPMSINRICYSVSYNAIYVETYGSARSSLK